MKVYYYQGIEEHLDVYELEPVCDVFFSFEELVDGLKKEYESGKDVCSDKQELIKEDEFYVDRDKEVAYVSIECEGYYQLKVGTSFKQLENKNT